MTKRRDFLKNAGGALGLGVLSEDALASHNDSWKWWHEEENHGEDEHDRNKDDDYDDHKDNDNDGRLTEEEALTQFEEGIREVGEVNDAVTSTGNYNGLTAFTLGTDLTEQDLYAVSFSETDNAFINGGAEDEFRSIAESIAEYGQHMVVNDLLPNEEVAVYAGPTGRNNSFMPMRIEFEQGEDFDREEKVEEAYEDLVFAAAEAVEELNEYQQDALGQLGGFDDEYSDNHRFVVMESIDGVENGWDDDGEFRLHETAELMDTEDNDGVKSVKVRYNQEDWKRNKKYVDDDKFFVGQYELKPTFVDSFGDYAEFTMVQGQDGYDDFERMPFPQIEEPF